MSGEEALRREKNALRRRFRAYRKALPLQEKQRSDTAITAALLNSSAYRACTQLLVYCSLSDEVDTDALIRTALEQGKQVAAPVCCEAEHTMRFYILRSLDDLETGAYGIRAPDPARCAEAIPDAATLCLVPAFTFDRRGLRLGYGGGYYDRFLAGYPGRTAGLCRGAWLAETLPTGSWDRPVDAVITEDGILFPERENTLEGDF